MRVSLVFLIFVTIVFAETSSPPFDQMKWNYDVGNILGNIWVKQFGDHFTPQYFAANMTRDMRIEKQCIRLRARVGTRLIETLDDTEIICQDSHFSVEAFLQVEKELKEKGWDAHWIPKTLEKECGRRSRGFLFVKIKP